MAVKSNCGSEAINGSEKGEDENEGTRLRSGWEQWNAQGPQCPLVFLGEELAVFAERNWKRGDRRQKAGDSRVRRGGFLGIGLSSEDGKRE